MNTNHDDDIHILIADDDDSILECYRKAFRENEATDYMVALEAELFEAVPEIDTAPKFNVVACNQGRDAITLAQEAARQGRPFDVVILDVRMPPGIDGVEAGSQIRKLDPKVEIIFVSGYSDIPRAELERRVPPPFKLHYFNKPLSFMRLAEDVASMVKSN